ncbi:SET domain-containing protein-lysine N-methyltransferase [Pseudomonas sp. W2Aug9]|uniref:SET domain-containing protein-lysine N-methyltransferase n=1 Tax=Pseudomonas sp. W2Aug9 TaxID=1215242 RepID=UPI002003CA02|nr:SET domain-containing protein-lysine N-methyltransferase [Pseudomonas sp. W2Aug9]MCK3827119.1 SET domain-containing protein [Pseudomonas sp. W2Aug9]
MTSISAAHTHFSLSPPAAENQSAPVTDTSLTPQPPNQDVPLPGNPAPSLGHLGGALSWPVPLSADEQRRLRLITMNHAHHLGDQPLVMQTKGGVLEFLRYRQPLPASVQDDPAKMLEALIRSPQGQRMGKALQQRMQGIDSASSVTDYLLAGIALQMDHESISAPARNKIAGFDLASDHYWGHPPSAVVEGLAEHLSRTGKTSVALAKVGAYLLLAKSAPQFLIKDIPPTVKVGSQTWANLTIAAMTSEAQAPGKVPGMTFAQVMSEAENARRVDPVATQHAQAAALLDWGVANEIIPKRNADTYTAAQLETVRTEFNQQLDERMSASKILDKAIPTRTEIAQIKLQERFGDLGALFEVKALSTDASRVEHGQNGISGTHSLLDYAKMDLPNPRPLKSSDSRIPVEALNNNPTFGVREAFEQQFTSAIQAKKAAINTTVRHLISQLPSADRRNLEFGKISFFQEGSYVMDGHFNNTQAQNKPGLLVKTEWYGTTKAYVIDFNKGSIERASVYAAQVQESRAGKNVSTTKAFTPRHNADELGRERPLSDALVNSFTSARSRSIADAFVQHLDLDDPAIKEQARGQTPLDEYYSPKPLNDFLLNLIPFRSAIVNIQNGKYGEAAFDLMLDIFGFVTAGAATAGKLLKIGSAVLSSGAKVLKAAKVIGVATIDLLNPVGGLGDLARLVGSGGLYVLSKTVNKLRGATGSYDVLKAISKQYDAAATGVVKVAEQTVEGAAVLKNGHWYAFDADAMRPYGSPLEEFVVATQAVAGKVGAPHLEEVSELSHEWFGQFNVPESRIAGLSRNGQGVYVAADGHLSHIRHIDSHGKAAVYEVRQVSRTEDGVVQARVYHNNRQTELLVQHIQGDQWHRLGATGGAKQITAEHLQAWEALPRQEQIRLTPKGFARQHQLPWKTFEYCVKADGRLSETGLIVRNRPANTPFNKVTEAHIQSWRSLTRHERGAMTLDGFAVHHHLNSHTLKNYVRVDGSLGPEGEELLGRAAGTAYEVITDEHLHRWRTLFTQPNNSVTQAQFISQHKLSPGSWSRFVKKDGSLKEAAVRRLNQAEQNTALAPTFQTSARKQIITGEHLQEWEALSSAQPRSITREDFAQQRKLSPKTFAYYVQPDGQLSDTGKIVRDRAANTPFNTLTETHIRDWQSKTQQARDAMTMNGFAGHHHLNPSTFKNGVRQDGGLGPAGEALLNRAAGLTYTALTDDHLRQWRALFAQSNRSVTPSQFLSQHGLNPNTWHQSVNADGSLKAATVQRLNRAEQDIPQLPVPEQPAASATRKRPAQDPLDPPPSKSSDLNTPTDTPHSEQIPGSSSDIVVIKIEPDVSPVLPRHQIDNTLPILQDPTNPRLSLTQSLEGPIEDIRIAHWNGVLDGLDSATKARVSARIKASIKDWLRTECQHQSRFDEVLEVVTPLDDGGPARGASVWARRDIPQFEVLGPYAGKYHADEASLFKEQRKQGSRAVLTYLFGTRSGVRTVSGLHTGNTLSLINTSQLRNGPAWKSNNVVSVAVGKNLTFYVALKDIKKGDELLLDYGPFYNPVPEIAIKPDPDR